MKKQQAGFTLIELIFVVVILGILAATAIPRFSGISNDARKSVAQSVHGAIVSAAVLQYAQNNGVAQSFATILDNVTINNAGGDQVAVSLNSIDYYDAIENDGTDVPECTKASDGDDNLSVRIGGETNGVVYTGALLDELCNS